MVVSPGKIKHEKKIRRACVYGAGVIILNGARFSLALWGNRSLEAWGCRWIDSIVQEGKASGWNQGEGSRGREKWWNSEIF